MDRRLITVGLLAVMACRDYDLESKLASQRGLISADQFARYGKEQAEAMAIAREFGKAAEGNTPEAMTKQADVAMAYARKLPDVADITADPLGHRLTIRFASGWRTAVTPVTGGKGDAGD